MILKSYIVEQNVEILKNYKATLIFGVNNGLKNDVKEEIKKKNKNCEIITFFENDILKSNLLYEKITNQSLFAVKKIIFIQEGTDKIFNEISECLKTMSNDIQIYILSGVLEKKSKLRSLFEKNEKLCALPCYEDNERTLISYINKELRNLKGLTGEIINLIISNSNMDRSVIKGELIKIKNFFLIKRINKKEVLEILNIKTNTSFDKIRDNALNGDKQKINELLSEIDFISEDTFLYLNNLNYRIMKLQEIIKISDGNKDNYEHVLETLRPPIFWKDKPIVMQQLKKWNSEKLEILAAKIGETEILIKNNSYLRNDIVIKDLITSLTNEASITSSFS
jgi:DNA polymerase-3 subunit delta